ncbi:hypothetical protein [Umezawaea beigongshangensis]|uniref:hypothetical protein n=1 Tax=Umezawaea beigongshangensis TaxID=2780383 RepID=UPI0018F14606|nr:hypothetical protein [Umezawaea beigongshangensis]
MSASNLETRYRRLLRALPRWYREEREEEMVALFLEERDDSTDLEHGWPGWGETWATLGLAVRTRLDGGGVRVLAPGAVVRLVALLGLVGLSAEEVTAGVAQAVRWALGWPLVPDRQPHVGLLLAAALAALLAGRRGTAAVLAVVSALPGAWWFVSSAVQGDAARSTVTWALVSLPLWVTAACLVAGFHRDAPPPSRRTWTRGTAAVWLAGLALVPLELVTAASAVRPVAVVALLVVAVAHLVTSRPGGAWPSALTVCVLVLLPESVRVVLVAGVPDAGVRAVAVGRVVALVAVGVALGVTRARRRRLTPSPVPGSPTR